MDLAIFWGRFHPLLVHLPIGLLIGVGITEGMALFPRFKDWGKLSSVLLLVAFVSSLLAAWMGLSLEHAGRYAGDALNRHKWMGPTLVALTGLLWIMKKGWLGDLSKWSPVGMLMALILMTITGHRGGELTHGEGYLSQFMPGSKTMEDELIAETPQDHDSIKIFQDLIQPVFEEKCMHCHGNERTYGGLNLGSLAKAQAGGLHGSLWVRGNPEESEIIKRLSLQRTNKKYMPPSGEPLTYPQIRLLSWWIESGASAKAGIPENPPKDIMAQLENRYGIDLSEKSYIESIGEKIFPDEELIQRLAQHGFRVEALAQNNGLLAVEAPDTSWEEGFVEVLQPAASFITVLNFQKYKGSLVEIGKIQDWPHLTQLTLMGQEIEIDKLNTILKAPHLESLNLTQTKIKGDLLAVLQGSEHLKTLYVWESSLNEKQISELERQLPNVELVKGFKW
ncbi:MAG: c-type cytochrome domain-containing protein [Bacteroidota bacterium]